MTNERLGQCFGNYCLIDHLGSGGFADTYLGKHTYLKTFAAIKALQTRLGTTDMRAFTTEARIIAHLKHPNIVHVLEFGIEDGTPYLVMEYAPNGTLRQLHARGIPLSVPTIVFYVKQIASALQYAHDNKIVHRDVKPENMLKGDNHEVLLSDFGLAVITPSLTHNAQNIAGTMSYMAPEQIQGRACPASDQYALAIAVYEWLCGAPPFGGTYAEVAIQHERMQPPALRKQLATISSDIEQVVLTALAKDSRQRFASIEAFARALEQAAQSPSVSSISDKEQVRTNSLSSLCAESVACPDNVSTHSEKQLARIATASRTLDAVSEHTPKKKLDYSTALLLPALKEQQQQAHITISPTSQQVLEPPQPLQHQSPHAVGLLRTTMQVHTPAMLAPRSIASIPALAPQKVAPARKLPARYVLLLFLISLLLAASSFLYYIRLYQPSFFSTNVHQKGETTTEILQGKTIVQTPSDPSAFLLNNMYMQDTHGSPTINDPLTMPDKLAWNIIMYNDARSKPIGGCNFDAGAYRDRSSHGYIVNCMAKATNFSNLAYQGEITLLAGHSGGLIIRGTTNNSGYYFRVSTEGTYSFEKVNGANNGNATQETLLSGTSSIITQGEKHSNVLTIIARRDIFYLYINKQYVNSTSDSTYRSGDIGVYTESEGDIVDAQFRHVQVWRL